MTLANTGVAFLSIIIPTPPGEADCRALDTVKGADYPQDMLEVFVVEGRQPSRQRNEAARLATGEVIFFLDSDSEFSRGMFKSNIRHYREQDACAVGGPSLSPPDEKFLQRCFGAGLRSMFGTMDTRARFKPIGKVRSTTEKEVILCNLSIKREVFNRYGGFDERLYPNEENEFLNRLTSNGDRIIYDPDLRVVRNNRGNLRQFIKQIFNYGRGRGEHYVLKPRFTKPLFFLPSVFIIYLLSMVFYHPYWYTAPFFVYALLALSFAAASAVEGRNVWLLPVMPFIFLIMHVSYGIGILWGCLKGFDKKKTGEAPVRTKVNIIRAKGFNSGYAF